MRWFSCLGALIRKAVSTTIKRLCSISYNGSYVDIKIAKNLSISINMANYWFAKHFNKIWKAHNIIVIQSNIGEAYLFIKYFLSTKSDDSTLIVCTKMAHKELLTMFNGNWRSCIIDDTDCAFLPDRLKIGPYKLTTVFSLAHYELFRKSVKQRESHYYKDMQEFVKKYELDIPNEANTIKISQLSLIIAKRQLESMGIEEGNFIYLFPYANSCVGLTFDELASVIKEAEKANMKVLVNCDDSHNMPGSVNLVRCYFRINFVFALAKLSRLIIGVKSGLLEVLMETHRPCLMLITKHKKFGSVEIDATDVKAGYSIDSLPYKYRAQEATSFDSFMLEYRNLIKLVEYERGHASS